MTVPGRRNSMRTAHLARTRQRGLFRRNRKNKNLKLKKKKREGGLDHKRPCIPDKGASGLYFNDIDDSDYKFQTAVLFENTV